MALTKVRAAGAEGLTLSSTDVTVASGDLLFGEVSKLIPMPMITYLMSLCSTISVIIPAILLSLTIMSFGHFI